MKLHIKLWNFHDEKLPNTFILRNIMVRLTWRHFTWFYKTVKLFYFILKKMYAKTLRLKQSWTFIYNTKIYALRNHWKSC